jgi:hypothetical protein
MSVSMKEVKKGTRVMLKQGWEAEVLDNLTNRQTRMCKVYGDYEEMGSVYSSDIHWALVGDKWESVAHSDKTLELAKARNSWGF